MKIKDRFNYLAILASEDEIPFGAARRCVSPTFFQFLWRKKGIGKISFTVDL